MIKRRFERLLFLLDRCLPESRDPSNALRQSGQQQITRLRQPLVWLVPPLRSSRFCARRSRTEIRSDLTYERTDGRTDGRNGRTKRRSGRIGNPDEGTTTECFLPDAKKFTGVARLPGLMPPNVWSGVGGWGGGNVESRNRCLAGGCAKYAKGENSAKRIFFVAAVAMLTREES